MQLVIVRLPYIVLVYKHAVKSKIAAVVRYYPGSIMYLG